jgi:hypothetical protein
MKKTFTKDFYLSHRGCYEFNKMFNLVDNNPHETIEDFLNWDISIKDKFFFLRNYCDLTLRNKLDMALMCAKVVLPVYEKEFPNDSRVMECIHATELFLNGEITLEQLREKRAAADAAYDAANADAAAHAAYAAYAANAAAADAYAYAYANAANAANAAAADAYAYAYAANAANAYAAYAAAYAADAADAYEYTDGLLNAVKEFCKKLPEE